MYIKVNVIPDSKKEVISKISDDKFEMFIKEPAQDGLANKRVLEILRQYFPNKSIKIVAGHHWPNKLFIVE